MSKGTHLSSGPARLLANCVDGKAVLAINAASAATVKTTNAIAYCVNGIALSKTALSAQVLTALSASDTNAPAGYLQPAQQAGFYTQPANTTAYLVLCLDAAGNVRVVQGTYDGQVLTNFGNGYTIVGRSFVPDIPDNWVAFGLIKVVTGATTFLPGTDALDKASVTFTFYDLKVLPVAQQP